MVDGGKPDEEHADAPTQGAEDDAGGMRDDAPETMSEVATEEAYDEGIDEAPRVPPGEALDDTPDEGTGEPSFLSAPAPIASFTDVTKSYQGAHAVGPVNLTLDGDCIGLLGPNGAGKTTMLRLLMGLIPPTSGELQVLGEDVSEAGPRVRQRIGYAPEGETQFPHLNGIQAVAYAGRLVGMGKVDAMQRAHQVLDYVGLRDERYRQVSTYSTGMRQRLKLAQALVHDPELLILDEPTEGVDPQAREHLLELIEELRREHGLRVLVSTHLLADVERLATHAIVLDQGRVAAHGPLDELRRAGARGHVVRVNGPTDALTARLDEAGVAWQSMAPDLRVELEDPREVLRHVKEAGLVVRHLAPVRLRLEEAFEQAVGGGAPA